MTKEMESNVSHEGITFLKSIYVYANAPERDETKNSVR